VNIGASLVGQLIVLGDDGEPQRVQIDAVDDHAQDVMAELDALGVADPTIHTCFENGVFTMTIDVIVDAESALEAAGLASAVIRSAIHAAGGHTPDWPLFRWDLHGIRFSADTDMNVDLAEV